MSTSHTLKIGLFGIGLEAYWSQFEGLEEKLTGYLSHVDDKLQRPGVEVGAWVDAAKVAHVMEHNRLGVMGHDGPGHIAIAEGKTKVRPLDVYHGKVGRGLSVEMSVKHGHVTLLSVVQRVDGTLELLVAEGESVAGPILEIGNTNSRYQFACGARVFVESWNARGPAHHCAVGVGHIASKIEKLALLLGLGFHRVV